MSQNEFEIARDNQMKEDAITLFGHTPGDVLSLFQSSDLASQGYFILGRIMPHKAQYINNEGENISLIDSETKLYAATFIRNAAVSHCEG